MAEVELPAVGKVDRKWVWVGGAAAVAIAAWWWMRRGDQSEADQIAEEAAAANEAITGTLGATGYVNPNPNAAGAGSVDSGENEVDTAPEWSDRVTSILSELGMEPGFIASTLGKYLAGQPLTAEEAQLVQTAWAYAGKPPGGPSTFTLIGSGSTPGGTPRPSRPILTPRRPAMADAQPSPGGARRIPYPTRRV